METQRDTQRERLFYIDFLAFFIGQVTRRDLVNRFGISEPAATKDLSLYADLAPTMLEYDLRQRCYVYGHGTPLFTHDVDHALFSLSGERAVAFNSEHAKRLPSWVQLSIKRKMPVELVATLTRAMFLRRQVEASYVSLEGGAATRKLTPLAVVHDGLRWHFRCYDHAKFKAKDYNLARFNGACEAGPSEATLNDDSEWNTHVIVKLVPHPKAKHPETIRLDYDIGSDTKEIELRLCLVPFFLRHWHIDTTLGGSKNPMEHQLFLQNRQELLDAGVSAWVFDRDLELDKIQFERSIS